MEWISTVVAALSVAAGVFSSLQATQKQQCPLKKWCSAWDRDTGCTWETSNALGD